MPLRSTFPKSGAALILLAGFAAIRILVKRGRGALGAAESIGADLRHRPGVVCQGLLVIITVVLASGASYRLNRLLNTWLIA